MNSYERLMAEEIPARHTPPEPFGPHAPWTPAEQAQHYADLLTAIADWHWRDETRIAKRHRRHLRLLDTDDRAA